MNCNDFYVEMLERGINNERRNLLRKNSKLAVVTFSGWIGIVKTAAVQAYCKKHSESLYFSFANAEYALALKLFAQKYPHVFSDPNDWDEFLTSCTPGHPKNYAPSFLIRTCIKIPPRNSFRHNEALLRQFPTYGFRLHRGRLRQAKFYTSASR